MSLSEQTCFGFTWSLTHKDTFSSCTALSMSGYFDVVMLCLSMFSLAPDISLYGRNISHWIFHFIWQKSVYIFRTRLDKVLPAGYM